MVKLADSALSQDMFTADYFLVEELSPDPLPIAWMAVETLTQLTYSLHTDVVRGSLIKSSMYAFTMSFIVMSRAISPSKVKLPPSRNCVL